MKRGVFRAVAVTLALLMMVSLCGCELDVTVETMGGQNAGTTTQWVGTTGVANPTDPWDGETRVTTTVTNITTKTTTAAKVYEDMMYVDWDPSTRILKVVQKYSSTQDLMSIVKPVAPNSIMNFVNPKLIANTAKTVSNNVAAATAMPGAGGSESDWLGPHFINGDWHGGTHGHDGATTAETVDVVLKVNGVVTEGNVGTYAGEVTLTYTNNIWNSSTRETFLKEYYTLTFDGEYWHVECTLHFVKAASNWKSYYGMQCTYGPWQDTIAYGDEEPVSIGDAAGNTKASTWDCDTMTLRHSNGNALEMKMDRTYSLGRGVLLDKSTAAGGFTSAYPHPNGKAYFTLVNNGSSVNANAKYKWRGTYRFFYEG